MAQASGVNVNLVESRKDAVDIMPGNYDEVGIVDVVSDVGMVGSYDEVGIVDVVVSSSKVQGDVGIIGTTGSSEPTTQANVSVGEEPMLKCIVAGCGREFTSASGLRQHMRH